MKLNNINLNEFEHIEPLGDNLKIIVSNVHNFNMDTLLLANFVKLKNFCSVADLGSGCGTIPLILLKNNKNIHITAIEIQKDACDMLLRSLILNNITQNVDVVNENIKSFNPLKNSGSYDIVVCNPPYYKVSSGKKNKTYEKQLAKTEQACSIFDVAKTAFKLLKNGGYIYTCGRPFRLTDYFVAFRKFNIEPKLLQFVKSKNKNEPKLFLLSAKKLASPGLRILPNIIAEEQSIKFKKLI